MKFSDEYKLTEYYQVQSTIDYITKGKNKLSAGSYGDGIFSILDIDTSVNIIKSWNWKFNKRFIPIVATAFGDLFLYCVANQYVYYFQPQYNTNDMITKNIDELFDEAFNHPSIKSGLLQEEKFKKSHHYLAISNMEKHLFLNHGFYWEEQINPKIML